MRSKQSLSHGMPMGKRNEIQNSEAKQQTIFAVTVTCLNKATRSWLTGHCGLNLTHPPFPSTTKALHTEPT